MKKRNQFNIKEAIQALKTFNWIQKRERQEKDLEQRILWEILGTRGAHTYESLSKVLNCKLEDLALPIAKLCQKGFIHRVGSNYYQGEGWK